MKTWKDFQNENTMKTYKDFVEKTTPKKKSEWESMCETVENIKENSMEDLLVEKEKLSQVQTMDPAYQWMMRYMKYDDGKFTINFTFTLDELEKEKFLKTETCIKDSKKNYFENLITIAGECIQKGKKYKLDKEAPRYIANNNKYRFFPSMEPKEWKFGIQANTQEDILQCIKDIFESWGEKLDIELTSFDEKLSKWIYDKISNKLY